MRRPDDGASDGCWAAYLWQCWWGHISTRHEPDRPVPIGCTWQDIADALGYHVGTTVQQMAHVWAEANGVTLYQPGPAAVHAVARRQHENRSADFKYRMNCIVKAYAQPLRDLMNLPRLSDQGGSLVRHGESITLTAERRRR